MSGKTLKSEYSGLARAICWIDMYRGGGEGKLIRPLLVRVKPDLESYRGLDMTAAHALIRAMGLPEGRKNND